EIAMLVEQQDAGRRNQVGADLQRPPAAPSRPRRYAERDPARPRLTLSRYKQRETASADRHALAQPRRFIHRRNGAVQPDRDVRAALGQVRDRAMTLLRVVAEDEGDFAARFADTLEKSAESQGRCPFQAFVLAASSARTNAPSTPARPPSRAGTTY